MDLSCGKGGGRTKQIGENKVHFLGLISEGRGEEEAREAGENAGRVKRTLCLGHSLGSSSRSISKAAEAFSTEMSNVHFDTVCITAM